MYTTRNSILGTLAKALLVVLECSYAEMAMTLTHCARWITAQRSEIGEDGVLEFDTGEDLSLFIADMTQVVEDDGFDCKGYGVAIYIINRLTEEWDIIEEQMKSK